MNLIAALKELRGRILSGDKTQIGRIFSFPVPDSVFLPYFGDSLFMVQLEKDRHMLTQEMFNAHFDKISGAAELDGFGSLFTFINLDSLEHKDSIDVDTVLEKESSSRIYWIHILHDSLVDISYGTGHCQVQTAVDTAGMVKNSVAPVVDSAQDDSGDGDESACEHMASWDFSFDGKTLRLVHQGVAD